VTNPQTYWAERLPDIIFVGGRKRSGKDFVCDRLVAEAGFTKLHIVEPWLRQWAPRYGYAPDDWERAKTEHRAECQADAAAERAGDPMVLIRWMRAALAERKGPVCVTAVRFSNETELGMELGALCVRVKTSDETRRQRFLASGDDLALMDDPFEAEVDVMPVHIEISGEMPGTFYVPALANYYRKAQIAYWRRRVAIDVDELGEITR
jgi:hypothetical protein